MVTQAKDIQTFISRDLHSLLFLEEFVFSRNKFSPSTSSEIELADAVVLLGDVLLVYQIKERSSQATQKDDQKWFESKVVRKATKQIRNTLSYLSTYPEIRIPNERGHTFNLATSAARETIKIVVYQASSELPETSRAVRHHVSGTAGFIHIVNAGDYLELSRTLRVPEEIVRYFKYREMVLTRFASCAGLPEPAIAGHFIGGDHDVPPTLDSRLHLSRLVSDEKEWDLAPFLRGLYDHLSVPGVSDDYYKILLEFAKLPRSMWRKIKERIVLCIEKVQKDEFAKPYRVAVPATDCGFVFVPIDSKFSQRPDWSAVRLRGIEQLTRAHKYDQRLSKCIGLMVYKEGQHFHLDWILVEHKWEEDPDIQRALDENFPFRPVKPAEVYGYFMRED